MTIPTRPAEVTATELQRDYARVIRDAEYGRPTTVTRSGKPVAKVVHPDAGVTPGPELWQAAQEAYDRASHSALANASPTVMGALVELGELLHAYYGGQPGRQACGLCGTAITATASGTNWIDGSGYDHCDGTSASHEPAKETP